MTIDRQGFRVSEKRIKANDKGSKMMPFNKTTEALGISGTVQRFQLRWQNQPFIVLENSGHILLIGEAGIDQDGEEFVFRPDSN